MSTTSTEDRAAFIAGLLDLACFLEAHPDAPTPYLYDDSMVVNVFPDGDTDDERRAAVDSAAAALGTAAGESRLGSDHYLFSLRFGPVTYCMVAIPTGRTAATARDLDHDSNTRDDDAQVAA